jgi:mersacidin/lichenicidin family type 2 lantibiotic
MTVDIVRAWKDVEYRQSLTPEELASLPPHPTGAYILTEEELKQVTGGAASTIDTFNNICIITNPMICNAPHTEAMSCSHTFVCSKCL